MRLRCCCCNARYLRSHASAKTSRSGAHRSTAESQRWAVATQRPVGQLPAGNGACRLRCRRLPLWVPVGVLEHAWVQDQRAPIIGCVPWRATGAAEARARCGRVSDVDTTKAWCRPAFEARRLVLNADEGRENSAHDTTVIGYRHAGTPKWPSRIDSLAPSASAPLCTALMTVCFHPCHTSCRSAIGLRTDTTTDR